MSSHPTEPKKPKADDEHVSIHPSSAVMPNYLPIRTDPESAAGDQELEAAKVEPTADHDASVVEVIERLFADDCFSLSSLTEIGQPIVHASEALAQMSGYQQGELIGRNLGFLMRNDTEQSAEHTLRQAIASGKAVTVVVRTYRADGSLFWTEQRHYPVHDESGKPTHLLTLLRDVSDQVHAQGANALSLEMSDALEGDGRFFSYALLLHDDGREELAWASEGWQHLSGYDVSELLQRGAAQFAHKDDQRLLSERSAALRQVEHRVDQYRLMSRNGKIVWVEDFATRSWRSDEAGITAFYGMIKDITKARVGAADRWRLAHVDALTGLPNAHLLEDRIGQALLHARRSRTYTALVMLDLDNFRFVNQTFSQRHGDRLIIEVGRRLRRALRRTDTLARVGADTFALLFSDLPHPRSVLPALNKALAAVREPYQDGSLTLQLAASAGVDLQQEGVRSPALVVERAVAALRSAKESDRGSFRFFDSELHDAMRGRLALEEELRTALDQDQLLLHYQPRVQLDNGAIHSVEALVRWGHPKRGLLRPAEFVPLVEEAQLGPELFGWVVERACRQAKRWQRLRTPRRVAVNVSPSMLESGDLAGVVHSKLERYDLHPGLLELEISERTGHETLTASAHTLAEIRAMGVHVALDDFGVAHSSLTQLRGLPLDGLKIDRSFISKLDAHTPSEDVELLRAIIALGKSLRLRITAEGIETKAQNNLLRSLACDDGQGFLFSQAVPAEYVPAFA